VKYFIGVIALIVALILGSAAIYCAYRGFTGEVYFFFVMVGVLLPVVAAFLVTYAAFSAVKDY